MELHNSEIKRSFQRKALLWNPEMFYAIHFVNTAQFNQIFHLSDILYISD